MVGTPNRSGGSNRKARRISKSDGRPESPRELSLRASEIFNWVLEKLGAGDKTSPWKKIDGVLLSSLAEAIEAEERLGMMLDAAPEDIGIFRLRGQYADRIGRLSGLIGLCPRDRDRLPKDTEAAQKDDAFASILRRMGKGN